MCGQVRGDPRGRSAFFYKVREGIAVVVVVFVAEPDDDDSDSFRKLPRNITRDLFFCRCWGGWGGPVSFLGGWENVEHFIDWWIFFSNCCDISYTDLGVILK